MSVCWQETISRTQSLRRALLTQPKIVWEETRIAQRIRDFLTDLDISWRSCAHTGTVARINSNASGAPHTG